MIQQVQNSCQFHSLPGDDANKHLDKFLHVTQSIKVNGVTDDALYLYIFPHSLTHHDTAWFDRLSRNSNNTFEQMAKMFLEKYFPPSMVTKLRNEIINFRVPNCKTSSSDMEIAALKAEMVEINKKCMRVLQPLLARLRTYMLREPIKGITTRSGTAYQGTTIPTTSSSLPLVVERETEATKDTVHPTNNKGTKDVQPLVIRTESPILNS
nr:reverse transcriptase domain-containing protein [Tanacetum cinerariifolium]